MVSAADKICELATAAKESCSGNVAVASEIRTSGEGNVLEELNNPEPL